jgi:hypothetical protein
VLQLSDTDVQNALDDCIEDLMVSWFAYQNESLLAAQALVETIIAAHRSGWSVERVNMQLSFLSLQKQDIAGQQIGTLDNDMLLSFVAVGIYTCQVWFHSICSRLLCSLCHPSSLRCATILDSGPSRPLQDQQRSMLQG